MLKNTNPLVISGMSKPCAGFSLDTWTSDLKYEITDLHCVNLFAPLPPSVPV